MCEVTTDPKDGSPVTCSEESLENTVYSNVLNLIMSVSEETLDYRAYTHPHTHTHAHASMQAHTHIQAHAHAHACNFIMYNQ